MPKIKYTGAVMGVQVFGFGHFNPGDEKEVDHVTAGAFRDPRCKTEGWVVIEDEPVAAPAKKSAKLDE